MKKKIISVLIVMSMLLQAVVLAAGGDKVTIGTLQFGGTGITIPITTKMANEKYTMTVIKEGGSFSNKSDLYAFKEITTNAECYGEFTLSIPDFRNGVLNDGKYTISVKGRNSEKNTLTFDFVSETGKAEALNALKTAAAAGNADEMKRLMDSSAAERAAYLNLGFDFTNYDIAETADSIKIAAMTILADNMPEADEEITKTFELSVIMALMNNSAGNAEAYLANSSLAFDNVPYKNSDRKEWIADTLKANAPYTNPADFQSMYSTANILYKINNAKFDTVAGIIQSYASDLGIASDAVYASYIGLGNSITDAGEFLIIELAVSPAKTVNELLGAISKAVNQYKESGIKGNGGNKPSSGTGGIVVTGQTNVEEVIVNNTPVYGFSDLNSVPWAKDAVNYLYDRKIVSGMGDNRFEPNGVVTREAFTKMMVDAIGVHNQNAVSVFDDVKQGMWYTSYVASGAESGIIAGLDEATFGTGLSISRQDVAVIIARAAEKQNIVLSEADENFVFADDADISDYAKESVYKLYASGIINGMDDENFAPKGSCTRAQAARLIYMLLTYVPKGGNALADNMPKSEYSDKIRFVTGLGMIKGASDDTFDANEGMIKSTFIKSAMRLKYGEEIPYDDLLEAAKAYGIGDSEDYDYESLISCDEAVAIVINLLGYSLVYPDDTAFEIANKISVLNNVRFESGTAMTQAGIVNLLYNAATHKGVIVNNGNGTYGVETVMVIEANRDIYKYEAMVTDNGVTALNGQSTIGDDEVKIGEIIAYEGKSNAAEYLGKYVSAYIHMSDDNTVIYVEEKGNRNNELIISADEMPDADMSARKIKYHMNKSKLKYADFSAAVKVIKNGKYFSGYKEADLEIQNGILRLVDNDGNSEYDIIFIENYKYIIADGVLKDKQLIYNKYSDPASLDISDIEDAEIRYNGEEITVADINQKDVLNVLIDENETRVTVYITRDVVTGVISGMNTGEQTITVNGEEYELSDGLIKAVADGDAEAPDLKFGSAYDFYLDKFGKIVYAETSENSSEHKYIYGKKLTENDENGYTLKYYDVDEQAWKRIDFAEKVKYNGQGTYKIQDLIDTICKNGDTDEFKADIYRIKTDNEGKLASLEAAKETADDSVFNKKTFNTENIWGTNTFSFENKLFLRQDSKVLIIPKSGAEEDYTVTNRSHFKVDYGYTVTGYGVDEFSVADLVVTTSAIEITGSSPIMLAGNITYEEVDGEVLPRLNGAIDGNSNYSVLGRDENVFNGIKKGDVVGMSFDANGRVALAKVVFSYENSNGIKIQPSTFQQTLSELAGYVDRISYNDYRMVVDTGIEGGQSILANNETSVFIYDSEEDTLEAGTFSDITKNDYVYIRLNWSKVKLIYVIR